MTTFCTPCFTAAERTFSPPLFAVGIRDGSETINIPVKKVWIGPVKDSATVYVMNGDIEVANVKLSEDNGWHYEFTGLPKYDASGNKINHTIKEDAIKDYKAEVKGNTENGFTITNTITGKISIPVTKIWSGGTGDKAVVHLFADGTEVARRELNASNNWQYTFENLDEYKDGKKIPYTLTEDAVSGFKATITCADGKGFTVTNTKTTPKTPDKNTPTPGTKAAGGPKTGDTSHIGLWLILMLAALSGLVGNVIYMRKRR